MMTLNFLAGAQQANASGSLLSMIIPFVLFGAFAYFFLIRPQKKQAQKLQELRDSLKIGDQIVTIGGILAKIVQIKEDVYVIEINPGCNMEIAKWAFRDKASRKEIKNVEKSEDL